jgi:hypothetical protein
MTFDRGLQIRNIRPADQRIWLGNHAACGAARVAPPTRDTRVYPLTIRNLCRRCVCFGLQMRPRAIFLALIVLLGAITGLAPATAAAGHFSKPVRLPTKDEEWRFAVNNQDEAVGVHGSTKGAVVVQLGRSGRIAHSWLVKAPIHTEWVDPYVALGDRGRIAVGILYADSQQEPSHEYHGGPGCCDHVAIASWKLGERPPVAQAVSPPLTAATGTTHQPYPPILMTIAGSTVTALWARGYQPEYLEPEEGQLEEAFGRVGKPLQTAKLLTAPRGFAYLDLHLEPDGRPVVSWIDDGDTIRTVTGSLTGALSTPVHFQHIPTVSETNIAQAQAVGFTHDDEGDTTFAYISGNPEGPQKLLMMTSTYGSPFSRPREVASLPRETDRASIVAGGHRSLLALWTYTRGSTEHIEYRRGSAFGSFGRQFQIETTPYTGAGGTGFIDSYGRAVLIQPDAVAHHSSHFELDAFTAQQNSPFAHRQQIAPMLRDCGLNLGETIGIQPIATSPNGRAVFYATCEYGSHQEYSQYLIRYTP